MARIAKRYTCLLIGVAVGLLSYLHLVDVKFLLRGEYASELLVSKCRKPTSPYQLTITTMTKNSASYIREWIEYHMLIGVDHFFILDNESEDDIFGVLRPYIERQLVTYVPWRDSVYRDAQLQATLNTQQRGMVYALSLYGCKSDWTALIDDDEFLLPKGNRTVKEILKDYTNFGGLAVGWAWFGSNGHVNRPRTLVIKSYTMRKAELDILYKTIIQPQYFHRMKTIHYPVFNQGYLLVTEHFKTVSTLPEHVKKFAYTLNHPTSDIIQLNHYKVKSQEDWIERLQRGAVAGGRWRDKLSDFYINDWNEVEDKDILRYLPALRQRMFPEQ